ncbi:helix-turn-helix transcriptional regulator [Mycobacterium sp. 3519A]|uniref:helix-turn-helix transcriptional regulator n=1 Tax=Mycobacterium sp. 3519A TaxID=2057184 RepID=UPI000C7D34AA|nr:helix-turn-helix transcriptional regulator [Mycobacterium sp. 3519A]
MLHGRAAELGQIRQLLAAARAGHSSMLVLAGETGSGKTALLEHAASAAEDFRVLRCAGVESEFELPFAALHVLLRDWLTRLAVLPPPQATALQSAFGLIDSPGADRFLTGLATLTLLSEAAAEQPLLCLIDDAQWVDRESREALLFAGRRLGEEGVVVLFAVHEHTTTDLRGLPMMAVGGIDDSAAAGLIAEHAADLTPQTRDRLIADARGNPLALIEFAAAAGAGQLTPAAPPMAAHRVLDSFGSQVDRLPPTTRLALLLAAAEGTGELGSVLGAGRRLGLGLEDFESAERRRLVRVGDDVVAFRHPLIRSAVYQRAPAADRVAVHRALADALGGHDDRRAWHLAAAAEGFDDEAADGLEAAALRADRRGGYAASAAAHERAAQLTADRLVRGDRLTAAAMSARDSGQLPRAAALAHEASALTEDARALAKLAWVRARLEFERGTPRHASEMVLAGAETVYGCDAEEAARMLIEVVRMAYFADAAPQLGRTAELIDAVPLAADHPLRPMLAASAILARLQSGEPDDQIPPLPPAVRAIQPEQLGMTVGNLAVHHAFLLMVIGDADEALAQTERMLVEARARGLIGGLPHILLQHAQAALVSGRLREALRAANEGVQIAEDTGQLHSAANLRGVVARITAMTGDEQTCVALAREAIHVGTERHSSSVGLAVLALAVLELGYGRYSAALERLASLPSLLRRHPTFAYLSPPEWAEAAARSGQPERAAEMMTAYLAWATHRDSPVVGANVHRCRALLGPDDEAEAHYRAAIRLYDGINRPMARARCELLYGEWLRRMRRRSESREPLRGALRVFDRIGARSWAERARAELRATGETVAALSEPGGAQLTPQELQVVRLAAAGLSNRDIGAQLFISPRTAGYHLYKAFPKLGVAGRHELASLDLSANTVI